MCYKLILLNSNIFFLVYLNYNIREFYSSLNFSRPQILGQLDVLFVGIDGIAAKFSVYALEL